MTKELSKAEMAKLLAELKESAPLKECLTCECFQGYISQLEVDSPCDISDLIESFQVDEKELHKCLGCTPCPPADLYTKYLMKNKES